MNVRIRVSAATGPLALVILALAPAPALPQSACPDPASVTAGTTGALAHVRYLADDALEGRGSGTPGERCAAAYIVARLQEIGLEPAGEDGTWFQSFPIRTGARVERGMLQVGGSAARSVAADPASWNPRTDDWTAYGFSGSGDVEAALVYDGEGVARPGSGEVRAPADGKVVVVEGEGSVGGLYGDPHFKASVAAGRRAAGVIVLLPAGAELPDASGEVRPALGVPVAVVRGEAADMLRDAARAGRAARLAVDVEPVVSDARNVVAMLPGSDPAAMRDVVILGAHYDHLGMGGEGSLAPGARAIHNGADDNASGTSALIEAARSLAAGPAPRASVLFIAFSGEEKGLLGSAHFVRRPTVPLGGALAMVNMDMVGRLRDNTLTVYGFGTAEEWDAVVEGANVAAGAAGGFEPMVLSKLPDGFGPSDHASFHGAGIPVLHLFTNTHAEYHRPQDDWQTVDPAGIEKVAALAAEIARRVAGTAGRTATALTPMETSAGDPHGAAPSSSADRPASGGYGPYLGTIPDMSPMESGVRITGVSPGSPAEQAGLQGGDVIVQFAGKEIDDLYAYTYALRDQEPGDEVEIVVVRDGTRVTLTAVLGTRR